MERRAAPRTNTEVNARVGRLMVLVRWGDCFVFRRMPATGDVEERGEAVAVDNMVDDQLLSVEGGRRWGGYYLSKRERRNQRQHTRHPYMFFFYEVSSVEIDHLAGLS